MYIQQVSPQTPSPTPPHPNPACDGQVVTHVQCATGTLKFLWLAGVGGGGEGGGVLVVGLVGEGGRKQSVLVGLD